MKRFVKKLALDLAVLVFMVVAAVAFYVYVPRSAINLYRRIAATSPGEINEERRVLSLELEKYLAYGLTRDPGKTASLLHLYLANQRKFFDLRFKQAITEVETSEVGSGRARVWSFMNMGVVVKTQDKLIAFDIADMPESVVQKRLADMADIFFVTHADMNHYDPTLLKKALRQGKAVVFPENFRFMYEDQGFSGIYKLKDGEAVNIDGIKVTAFQTDHRGDGILGFRMHGT